MIYKVKVSLDFPIVGITEVEADTEADALRIATERYGKDKKNFNVELVQEEAAEAVHSTGDVRQSSGSDNSVGSDISIGGSQGSKEAPLEAE